MSGLSVTPVQLSAPRLSRSQSRLIPAASLGGSLEFYDFIIYGIFAQYIAVQFFPAKNTFVSLILSFSVLALGFRARPVGGIVLSGLGDCFGRRPVFLVSLFRTTIATILMEVFTKNAVNLKYLHPIHRRTILIKSSKL